MQPGTTRRSLTRNGVAVGSVWETRMKLDEVRGGIKVFNADGDGRDDEEGLRIHGKLRRSQNDGVGLQKRKRKNWKQPEPQRSPIPMRKARSTDITCKSQVVEKGVLLRFEGQKIDEEMVGEEIEIEIEEQRRFDDKEMDLPAEEEKKVEEVKKIERKLDMSVPLPPTVVVEKISYAEDLKAEDPDRVLQIQGDEKEEILLEGVSGASSNMQHIVDLVMWRDISKTSFAFGFGTFFLLSSSYAKDLNFSLISVISYLGLLYLAIIFLLRSIIRRGREPESTVADDRYLVREEEAIWILRRALPYINELLLRTRALFSGDPATTMKMAVILFVMAKCGSSITIWTLAKLAFYGVFTVPKVLSSYSAQLSRHGQFWLARFQDGWESCTHKKVIAAAIFTLTWNLSSTVARVWALFVLVVAIRFYQQCMITPCEDAADQNHHQQQQQQQQQQREQDTASTSRLIARPRERGPAIIEMGKNVSMKKAK